MYDNPVDMAGLRTWFGDENYVGPTKISVTDGTYVAVYEGRFSYVGEEVFGTLTRFWEGPEGLQILIDITGLNVDANLAQKLIYANDIMSLLSIGLAGADRINGSKGADNLLAFAGNDTIVGGNGNDTIDGGAGTDIAAFTGAREQYTVTRDAAGTIVVYDNAANRDGIDVLHNIETLTFAGRPIPADLADAPPVPSAVTSQINTVYRAIERETPSADTALRVGVDIVKNTYTIDAYVNQLIQEAATSTIPALLMAGIVEGRLSTSAKLDSLAAFAEAQYDYYRNVLGSASAALGPYEALGRAFASTNSFQTKFGSGNDSDFVAKAYDDIFGHAPTAAQQSALLSQVTYFEQLYQRAGISAAVAEDQARGAVYGQIVGYAVADTSLPYDDYADGILRGFVKGDNSHYGAVFGT
jgi:hypothetical protein